MMMVLAVGTSMPVSMIVEQSEQVDALRVEVAHHVLELALGHLAVRDGDARLGQQLRSRLARSCGSCRCRCAGSRSGRRASARAAPPRGSMPVENVATNVLIASRRCGAVAITEKSRMPSSDIASVRGIGVAVSVSTSTSARSRFSCSFWRTPKRCSSSMMTRPRFLNLTSDCEQLVRADRRGRCVPSARPSSAAFTSFVERKRDSSASLTGQSAKRSEKTWKCCSASSVVGTSSATCLPSVERDERGAQRDLGLAEADVAADEAVHRPAGETRSGDHRVDRRLLVRRLLEAEALGERLVVVRLERNAWPSRAARCA